MFLIRIPLTILFVYSLYKASVSYPHFSALETIFLMFYVLLGALVISLLWAPVIGEKISTPLTAGFTEETSLPTPVNPWIRRITRLQARGYHRLALTCCFLEGLRHPDLPHPALLGLRSVRPGSLLEKWFAREVYRYNNIQNCLLAYTILKERHGETPPPHKQPEVNLAILSLTRQPAPEAPKLKVESNAAPPRLERNRRIKLFDETP